MKITSRTLRALPALLLALLLSGTDLFAQGFVKSYPSPSANLYANNYKVYETPQGYTIVGALNANFSPDSARHFTVRHTDFNGVETQPVVAFDLTPPAYGHSGHNRTAIVSGNLLDTSHVLLVKNDINGALLWQKTVEIPGHLSAITDVEVASTGEIFVSLLTVPQVVQWSIPFNSTVAKLDANGNLLWVATEYNGFLDAILSTSNVITPSEDGGCFLHYGEYEYYKMAKVSATGEVLWRDSFWVDITEAFVTLPKHGLTGNGGIAMTGFPQPYSPPFIKAWDAQGTLTWDAWNLSALMDVITNFYTGTIIATADGGTIIIGQGFTNNGAAVFASKFAADGTQLWHKRYRDFDYQQFSVFSFAGGCQTADGGYAVAGSLNGVDIFLKMDGNGNIHSNLTIGTVAGDVDSDCLIGNTDIPMPNTLLQASGNGNVYWAISDAAGQFEFPADTGSYTIQLQPTSYLWQPCFDSLTVNFPDTGMVQTADFPMQAIADCPLMTVDVYTPRLRRCFTNLVGVNYCNLGSANAVDATVTITLDAGLDFDGASIPGTQNGQEISFPIGTVNVGECGSFQLFVTPNCDATALGESKCITAHVTPDTICGAVNGWSGATIEANAQCQGDSVLFTIRNIGMAPSSTLGYVIIDDHVVMMTDEFQLDAGAENSFTVPVSGQTMRLTCDQEPGHPVATKPSVGIEACGPGLPSQGLLVQFPNQSGSPFDATICRLIVGSYDPNDKIASPAGVGSKHFIEKNTDIEYLINFQNTGTDTAFQVVILDTLSAELDPFSIRGTAGSHATEVELLENNVLRFVMSNILLPDSTTNEAGSHGFVRFKVKQKRDLVDGTLIKNRAAIYFDYNQPIITNEVFHEVGREVFETSNTDEWPSLQPNLVDVSPNPASEKVMVSLQDVSMATGVCRLSDCLGRIISEQRFDAPAFELKRNGLPAGIYFLEIRSETAGSWAGKVIWD